MDLRAKSTLFICVGNSARSIIAEAILSRLGGARFEVFSAGSAPKGFVHPLVLEHLDAEGYETKRFSSKSLAAFLGPGSPPWDIVISVCADEAEKLCTNLPGQPTISNWSLPDPVGPGLDDEVQRARIAETYDVLWRRLAVLSNLPEHDLAHFTMRQLDRMVVGR